MMRNWFGLSAMMCLVTGLMARGDNWPEFRGPTGQGLVKNGSLPVEWTSTRNVVWKKPIPGKGWSSPIVHEGRLYLTSSVAANQGPNSDQSLRALCLDAETGKVLWDKEVFRQEGRKAARIHTKNSHASPTPITDGQKLYVHFGHQGTACLDLDGKVIWRNTDLKYQPVHGNGGSPILVDDLLVFSIDGSDKQIIVALDRGNGKVGWKTDRNSPAEKTFSFSTPLLITVQGQQQIISAGSNAVLALEPRTGKEIWRVRYQGYSVIPRPVFGHDLVFVCTGYDSPSVLAIRPDGQGDVTGTHIAWKTRNGAPHTASPLLVENELYLVSDNGLASCLDAKTGQVHWQKRVGGGFSASPLFAGGKIYFQSEQGLGVVVQAGKEFKQLARNDVEERTLASYAAADGALFLRTEKHLYRIQTR